MGSLSEGSLKENVLTSEPLYLTELEEFKIQYYKLEAEYKAQINKNEELECDRALLIEDLNESEAFIDKQEEELKALKWELEKLLSNSGQNEKLPVETTTVAQAEYESIIAQKNKENEDLVKSNLRMKEALKQIARNFIDSIQKIPRKESTTDLEKILREKNSAIKALQEENKIMLEEIKNYEEYIRDHIDQMKKLAFYIDQLTNESKEKQQETSNKSINYLNTKINIYRAKLKKEIQNNKIVTQQLKKQKKSKDETERALSRTVKIYKNLLKENQNLKNKNSILEIQNVELDNLRLRAHKLENVDEQNKCLAQEIETFKARENELMEQNMALAIQIDDFTKEICDYKSTIFLKDQNNRILLNTLEHEKSEVSNLKSALKTLTRSEEELKEMLAQARSTIKAITQKLEENDIERLELEDRSQNLSEKYNTLKTVLYEKDKSFDDLRNQLVTLKNLLDREQKVKEDHANLAAAGDSEIAQQVKHLNDEIARLKQELESLMTTSPIGRLRSKIKKLEKENLDLQLEVKKFVAYLKKIVPGYINPEELKKLREDLSNVSKEVEKQKEEVENQKRLRNETVEQLKATMNEHEEHCKKIKELNQENENLKAKLNGTGRRDETLEKVTSYNDSNQIKDLESQLSKANTDIYNLESQLANDRIPEPRRMPELRGESDRDRIQRLALSNQEIASINEKLVKVKAAVPQLHLDKTIQDENLEKIKELEAKLFYSKEDIQILKRELQTVQAQPRKSDDKDVVKALEEKLFYANEEIYQLKKQLANQKSPNLPNESERIQDLEKKLLKSNEEKNQLREQLESAKSKKFDEETATTIKKLQEELKTAKEKLRQADTNEVANLKRELEASKDKINDLMRKLDDNRPRENKLKVTRSSQLSSPTNSQTNITKRESSKGFTENLKECESENQRLRKRIVELEEQSKTLLGHNLELRANAKTVSASDLYQSQLQDIKNNMITWQNQMMKNLENMSSKIKDLEHLNVEEAGASSKQDLVNHFDNLMSDLEAATSKKRVTIIQDTHEKYIEELDRQLKACREENRKLRSEFANLGPSSPDTNSASFKDLEQQLKKCMIQKKNLQAEIDKLRFQRMSILSVVEDHDEKEVMQFPKLVAGINTDDERVRELEKRLVEWQRNYYRDIAKLKSEMEEITYQPESCQAHTKVIKGLEASLEEAQQKIDNLLKNNMQLEADNEQLTAAMKFDSEETGAEDEGNHKMHSLVEHLSTLERKNQSLKARIVQLEVDNGRLRNDLESVIGRDPKSFEEEMKRLRSLDRKASKCQEKYQALKKRLTKVEIENRNLQKEYINILIEKEKLVLQAHENTSRFRETGRLLKKAQDKIQSLTDRVIKMQNENEKLKKHLESFITTTEVPDSEEKERTNVNTLTARNTVLEEENQKLRQVIEEFSDDCKDKVALPQELIDFLKIPQDEDLRFKTILLKLENESLQKEIDNIKNRDIVSLAGDLAEQKIAEHFGDLQQIDQNKKADHIVMELQIENDYLRKELASREKTAETFGEKKFNEIEEENHKLLDNIDNLKKGMVDLELENEFLKNELDKTSKFVDSPQADPALEKQNHTLRVKIGSLEEEIKKLNQEIESMGQAKMDIQIHYQKKLINEIERVLQINNDLKKKQVTNQKDVEDLDNMLKLWKNKYEPQLEEMKKNIQRLMGKETLAAKLESQIEDYKELVNELENENQNMRMALEILMEEKAVLSNTRLVEKVEEQLNQHKNEKNKPMSAADERRMKQLEKELDDVQQINNLLREEKILLTAHMREVKIQELEDKVAFLQVLHKPHISSQSHREGTEVSEELKELQEVNESLQKHIESLNSDRTLIQSELKSYQTENEELKKEIERYEKISEQQQKIKTDLEKQIEEMKASLVPDRKVGFVNEEYEILKSDFRALHDKYENKQKKLVEMDAKLKKCKESNVNLTQKVAALHRNFEILQNSIDGTNREHANERIDEVVKLQNQIEMLKDEVEKKQKRISELEEELKKCRDVNKEFKKKIAVMEKNFQFVENEEQTPDSTPNDDARKLNKSASYANEYDGKQHKQQLKMYTVQKENNVLKGKIEQLHNLQEQRLNRVKELQAENDKLREENRNLLIDTKRVKVLEERLRETNLKYAKINSDFERLEKGKYSIFGKKTNKKVADLEKELLDKQLENDVFKEELDYLRKELQSKDFIEKENKDLKQKVNVLTQKLTCSEKDNKQLKDELNRLSQVEKNLLKVNQDLYAEKQQLEEKLKVVNCKKCELLNIELDEEKKKNEKLKIIICDLRKELEVKKAKGDSDNDEIQQLKDSLLKSQESNEYLKIKIESLIKQLKSSNFDEFGESNAILLSKLDEILSSTPNVFEQEPDFHDKKILGLDEQIGVCKLENEKLKLSTLQLEEEIVNLRVPEGNDLSDHESLTFGEHQRIKLLERELTEQKRQWKTVLSKLKGQYHEGLSAKTSLINPWMQPLMPNTYPPVHLFWQPLVTYPTIVEHESPRDDNLEQLSDMIEKIEKTLDKSKKVLGSEIQKCAQQTYKALSDKAEVDQVDCDLCDFGGELKQEQMTAKAVKQSDGSAQDKSENSERCGVVYGASRKCSYKCLKRDNDRIPSIFPHYAAVLENKGDDNIDNLKENCGSDD